MRRTLATVALLVIQSAALPFVPELAPDPNSTLAEYNETEVKTTALTTSTIAPTVESRPQKEAGDLEQTMKALGCNIPLVPADVNLWKGNQTHELLLPAKVSRSFCWVGFGRNDNSMFATILRLQVFASQAQKSRFV